MAMEKQAVITETHHRQVTAIGFHPVRREILAGFEDGVIKTFEAEGSKLVHMSWEHQGWITAFLYWTEGKVMFSSSNDGYIVAWASGGGVFDKIRVGSPVYCMALHVRRRQMVCGFNQAIRVFSLDEGGAVQPSAVADKDGSHLIHIKSGSTSTEHTDIVKCIVCHESRVYSAGYDSKLIIYDSSSYPGHRGLSPVFINHKAHEAGISTLVLVKDTENNTWLITGSFDKVVKIWSQDGKLTHRLDGFISTVTDICYVPKNKTLWVAGGSPIASLFDPKSGENVSDFIGTFQESEANEKYHIQLLKYFPELHQVVASTSRRHLIVWKYNPSACITALKCKNAVECLTYTKKVPILIFSGGNDGEVHKWERLQSNHFMYSKEVFPMSEAYSKLAQIKNIKRQAAAKQTLRAIGRPTQNTQNDRTLNQNNVVDKHKSALLQALFVEYLDLLLIASEDGNIYCWGFDDAAVDALKGMKPVGFEHLVKKYAILLNDDSELLINRCDQEIQEKDSVTNRVAGFICKNVLTGHSNCITSMVLVGRDNGYHSTYLLSSGWDRRICIWDLEKASLHDTFRNTSPNNSNDEELACDGIVIDMTYCPKRNEFAYASSDKMVYIRKFSEVGSDMTLCNTLQGHDAEITQVRWNKVTDKWITGSEDGTIRIWSEDGMSCDQILATHGAVLALCIDLKNGSIVAGVQNTIKVYDSQTFKLMQTNIGHSDSVRSIIHIPDRNQYISASWDKTIRIWNSYKQSKKKCLQKLDEKRDENSRHTANNPNYSVDSMYTPC
ncbi:uncharacterized protein [Antedon mediterranea]|uniref:uncharacterized protein n=1 Tax=Antedon mediterranea TaxID=105859 RepID=UPI003AF6B4E3